MMSQPVENLDAKTFKTAMESEHAAVGLGSTNPDDPY
jgi:hypothetical protein